MIKDITDLKSALYASLTDDELQFLFSLTEKERQEFFKDVIQAIKLQKEEVLRKSSENFLSEVV